VEIWHEELLEHREPTEIGVVPRYTQMPSWRKVNPSTQRIQIKKGRRKLYLSDERNGPSHDVGFV
jgi:hypothetical protein